MAQLPDAKIKVILDRSELDAELARIAEAGVRIDTAVKERDEKRKEKPSEAQAKTMGGDQGLLPQLRLALGTARAAADFAEIILPRITTAMTSLVDALVPDKLNEWMKRTLGLDLEGPARGAVSDFGRLVSGAAIRARSQLEAAIPSIQETVARTQAALQLGGQPTGEGSIELLKALWRVNVANESLRRTHRREVSEQTITALIAAAKGAF